MSYKENLERLKTLNVREDYKQAIDDAMVEGKGC